MLLQVGFLLHARYRITSLLAQSSAGAVYLATDQNLAVTCVVKENRNTSAEIDHLFRREATLLATLEHRGLPRVTNSFVIGDQQYLVMDYVEGEDLGQRLAREGPLPERLVLAWAVQLCDALTYLHTRHPPVWHRDVRPANIKVTPAGDVALVDFGVAKPTSADQPPAAGAFTPGFTPPEQYGFGRMDARADQYALGATLYTLLTGQVPPDSLDRLRGAARLVPPQTLRPDLSPAAAAAITRALDRKPEDRFPNVAAFSAALQGQAPAQTPAQPVGPGAPRPASAGETVVAGGSQPTTWKPRPAVAPSAAVPGPRVVAPPSIPAAAAPAVTRRPLWPWLVGLGCLVLLVGLAALALAWGGALMLSRSGATPTRIPAATPTNAILPSPTQPTAPATLAPTPSSLPATATTAATVAVTASPAVSAATPSPALTPTPGATATSAGPPVGGGGRIAFISNRDGQFFQVYTMNPNGGDVQQLTTDPTNKWDPKWPFNGTQLAWSPDGKQLIYVADSGGNGTDLFAINADGTNPVNLTKAAGNDFQPTWCSNGSIWFTTTRINGVHQIFHTDLKRVAQGLPAINFSLTHKSPREYDVTLYPGCQRALFVTTLDGPPELWRYWPDCEACYALVRSAKDQGGKTEEPALSPDGQYLAYTLSLPGSTEIVAGKLDDRTATAPVTSSKANSEPQWSTDGQWLVFVSSRDGHRQIYRMTLAGAKQTNLSNSPAVETDPVWEPAH